MATADGRLADAVRAFAGWICNDSEIAAMETTDFFEQWAARIPAMLRFIQQDTSYAGPRPTDPEALAKMSAPVLLLRGQQTALSTFVVEASQYIASHVPSPHVRELGRVGHFAPVIAPETVATELIHFSSRSSASP